MYFYAKYIKIVKKLFIILIVSLCFGFSSEAQAQKFGHLNSLELIADLPEIQAANTNLEVLSALKPDNI